MSETEPSIDACFQAQGVYFESGATLPRTARVERLRALASAVSRYESRFLAASYADLHRSDLEARATEVAIPLEETKLAIRKLRAWMRPKRSLPPLVNLPAMGESHVRPLGRNLIVSPWNYPFLLTLAPLVSCIAAGNVAMLKPSELSPASAEVIRELVRETFSPEFVAVFLGGVETSQALLRLPFDHIFFTGSPRVGKIVARAAAENLARVTLELGGKSPTIVMPSADLASASRRIVMGKFFNTGQSCVAPDYLLVHRSVHAALVERLQSDILAFFGADPRRSSDYGRIVNDAHFRRLVALIDEARVITGGTHDAAERYIAPTLLDSVSPQDPVMQEEVFGPLLPILAFERVEDALTIIARNPNPLALYLFTADPTDEQTFTTRVRFGGGCINTTLLHFNDGQLPFGGIGTSGQGIAHGHHGFSTFSHHLGLHRAMTVVDPSVRYPPYTPRKKAWIRRLMGT